jgi:hypothetical protein
MNTGNADINTTNADMSNLISFTKRDHDEIIGDWQPPGAWAQRAALRVNADFID